MSEETGLLGPNLVDGQKSLDAIREDIERQIEEQKKVTGDVGTRGGAVPRSLAAYRERSPGDTSPDAPPGTPMRAEGIFPQNRGEGLPITRGGGPPPGEGERLSEKERYWAQKNARKRAREEADRKFQSAKVASSGVKVADFAKFIVEEQHRMQLLSGRIEAFLIAMSVVSAQYPDDSPMREFCERFKAAVPVAADIWTKWRDTVNSIEQGDMNLIDMKRTVEDWNADLVNPRIARHCFHPRWILWKFSQGNPDVTLSLEEKKDLARSLGYADTEIEAMINGTFSKPEQ